jgi:hypothetical protein
MDSHFCRRQLYLVFLIAVYSSLASSLEVVIIAKDQGFNGVKFVLVGSLRWGSGRVLGRGI